MFFKTELESFDKMISFYDAEIAHMKQKRASLIAAQNRLVGEYAQVENAVLSNIWECEDPVNKAGYCIYDDDEDPCHDSCVFCGQPSERK